MLPAAKDIRLAAVRMVVEVAGSVERMVLRGDYAEIRSVDGKDFDKVINERNRVVIVVVHNKIRSSSRSEMHDMDEAIKKLPGRVLVAKVIAEENGPLLQRLNISTLPTIRVYQAGRIIHDFKGGVGKEALIGAVETCLNNSDVRRAGPGYIGPMDKNWIPEGVQRSLSRPKIPASKLE